MSLPKGPSSLSLLLRGRSNFFDWEIQLRLALKNVDLIDLWLPELSDIHAKHTARHNYSTLIQSWLIKPAIGAGSEKLQEFRRRDGDDQLGPIG